MGEGVSPIPLAFFLGSAIVTVAENAINFRSNAPEFLPSVISGKRLSTSIISHSGRFDYISVLVAGGYRPPIPLRCIFVVQRDDL
jgi:hypothetical protein